MSAYYEDETVTLLQGDALEQARTLPDESVDCIVTSPPYYGLRDYGAEGQYGLEESPSEYVETMRALFSELKRTLAEDGTLWLNIGDSYASDSKWGGATGGKHSKALHGDTSIGRGRKHSGLPDKNLIGIPWRLAFALQDDGWILRNAIIWHKPNAMPESVTDRLSSRYETVFMFTKAKKYWFDLDPVREAQSDVRGSRAGRNRFAKDHSQEGAGSLNTFDPKASINPTGKNPGDVWSINTQPFPGAHFAVFPKELARRCIVAGCKPGGTVLDPFSGSGTTGLVAQENGRKYIGIDINADYLKLSLETRLQNATLDFGGAA